MASKELNPSNYIEHHLQNLAFGECSDGKWRLSVIGDNLTDERIKTTGGTIPLARTFVKLASGGALDGIAYDAIYDRPKNITVKLDYKF